MFIKVKLLLIDHIMETFCNFNLHFSLILNKYALMMNPLARGVEELLPDSITSTNWCFILLRTALVISTVGAAFLIPFFGKF